MQKIRHGILYYPTKNSVIYTRFGHEEFDSKSDCVCRDPVLGKDFRPMPFHVKRSGVGVLKDYLAQDKRSQVTRREKRNPAYT